MGYPGTSSNVLSAHVVDKALLLAERQPASQREGLDRPRLGVGAAWGCLLSCSCTYSLVPALLLLRLAGCRYRCRCRRLWNLEPAITSVSISQGAHPAPTHHTSIWRTHAIHFNSFSCLLLLLANLPRIRTAATTLDSRLSIAFLSLWPANTIRFLAIDSRPSTTRLPQLTIPSPTFQQPPGRTWAF